jgi:hypothetical protein
MRSVEPRYPRWEPEPLQLPLHDEDRRVDEEEEDPEQPQPKRVIVIDLV